MSSIRSALNNGHTFSENINSQIKEITLTESTSYPLIFSTTVTGKPQGLWVVSINEISGAPATLSTSVFCDWEYIGNSKIKIKAITGLDATK